MKKKVIQVAMAIGQVLRRSKNLPNAVKVRVKTMELDERLLMYFSNRLDHWAIEKEAQCNIGDIVVIKGLADPPTLLVKHEVTDVVYRLGRVVDPLTGRTCRGRGFMEDDRPTVANTDFVKNISIAPPKAVKSTTRR